MKCPGQDIRYWKPGAVFDVKCPECGKDVEFFKDDTTRKCRNCGHKFINPKMDFGCAAYCQYAEQCIGDLPSAYKAQREEMLKERIAVEMKKYFKKDFKQIGHAMRVARYTERIGKGEGGNMAVVLAAAYLHDIGIHEAKRIKAGSVAENHEKTGPPIAKSIMTELGANKELIEEVCDIIAHHHHPPSDASLNFKIIYDADLIVNLEEKQKKNPVDNERLAEVIEKSFLTETGRKEARNVFGQ
ncbi:MAG: HD domain-containing protein [Proteobacteria bacterium]|nr:HD domain-containing protein [Desulfobacteraceae bacterium]MBU4012670.1 HD domain-containing protein [Pseudomonadota bacterium]MBU4067131.1 HD domain-containing protein [Pseudomonadota bacterium]MBU4126668.1 HD domain-containing protein [Pseudomonadota bacterium]